jgi:methyl-accepting chemotaxis protein
MSASNVCIPSVLIKIETGAVIMKTKAGTEAGQQVLRKYNEERERNAALNRTIIIGFTIFLLIIMIFTSFLFIREDGNALNNILVLGCIIGLIGNWIFYLRNHYSIMFHRIAIISYLLLYTIGFLICKNEYMQYTMLAILIVAVLFYKNIEMKLYCLVTGLVNIIYFIMLYSSTLKSNGIASLQELPHDERMVLWVALARTLFMLCLLYTIIRTSDRGILFNTDILGTVQEERQKQILEDVLMIAKNIRENAVMSGTIVNELGNSASIVNNAIGQIAASTGFTAENIQEQNVMTQEIQASINQTVERSKKMVSIAGESSSFIDDSMTVMEKLRVHSENIANTNQKVIQSMLELQQKTQSVQDVANIIFDILKQTNLLALNASIESARAGEAGKSFAVVADQIRKLAEQTKQSTNSITNILKELSNNAKAAMNTVNETITASNNQGELISVTSDRFYKINQNMDALAENIEEIDKMLAGLAQSNNTIVENISHISATTEEITANTEEATAISEKNLQNSREAAALLTEIIEHSHQLDKYI